MNRAVVIAIDAMSGDHGLASSVPAARLALEQHEALAVTLVGDEAALSAALAKWPGPLRARVRLKGSTEVVGMDELPSKALRLKKDSSMRVALNLLKAGDVQAVVSAGNTGALMATARFVLKTLPGVDRPAFISGMPSARGTTYMLDLGANAECTPEQLLQFGVMGSAMVTAVHGEARPKVALLNIGEEEIKGNEAIKAAAELMQASPLNYVGFVEGDGIFHADVDLVVTDGFVGNVALKSAEGVARLMQKFMREAFARNALTKLAALAALPVLKAFARRVDPRRYNGASLLGLRGIVIKSHGGADEVAFANAIAMAVREVQQDVPSRILTLLAAAESLAPSAAATA